MSAARSSARERIIDTATRLFYEHGIRAVGIDRIISESGVAKATLYAHFRSKNALVEAYLRRQADLAHDDLADVSATSTGEALIAELFRRSGVGADEDGYAGCHFLNALNERLDPEVGVTGIVEGYRRDLLDAFEEAVDAEAAAERADTARLILALFEGARVASVIEGGEAFARVAPLARSLARSAAPR